MLKFSAPRIRRWLVNSTRLAHVVVRPRIAVAMSGGIDSAVTAMLLKESGYDCVGVFMRNWDGTDELGRSPDCPIDKDLKDMQEVCKLLDIEAIEVEFIKEYWNNVFEPFLETYQTGYRTPNPDVMCNKYIKFHYFKHYVHEKLGLTRMATGHYADVTRYKHMDGILPQLTCPIDNIKDQTYFLSLTEGLAFQDVIFPLGSLMKYQVKEIARRHPKLSQCTAVLDKKESMGLCFVGPRSGGAKFGNFLGQYITFTPGRFIDTSTGNVVGQHSGIESLTLGQKANISGCQRKYYVVSKSHSDISTYLPLELIHQSGDVYVGDSQHPALFKSHIVTDGTVFNWLTCGVSAKLKLELDALPHVSNPMFHSGVAYRAHEPSNSQFSVNVHANRNPFMEAQRCLMYQLCLEVNTETQTRISTENGSLNSSAGLELEYVQGVIDGCISRYQGIPLSMPYESEQGIVDIHGLSRIREVASGYLDESIPVNVNAVSTASKGVVGKGLAVSITGMTLCVSDVESNSDSDRPAKTICASVGMRIDGLSCMHRYRQTRMPCSIRGRYIFKWNDEQATAVVAEARLGGGQLISLKPLLESLKLYDSLDVASNSNLNLNTAITASTGLKKMEVWFHDENGVEIKERAPTPGQTAVLYHGKYCIGGGEIL